MKNMQPLKADGRNLRVFSAGALVLLFAVIGLLLLPGCRNVLQQPGTAENDARAGTLSLTINRQDVGRTILPEIVPDNFVEFRLEFVSECGENDDFSTRWAEGSGTIDLDAGTWNLHVTAYMDGGSSFPSAQGSLLDIYVPAGGSVTGDVVLYPIREGQGTFSWNISFSDGISISYARMEILQVGVGGTPFSKTVSFLDVDGEPIPENNPGCLTLDSGQYEETFTLRNDYGETAVLSAILRVYRYMKSSFEKFFSYEYFPITLLNFILRSWDDAEGEWIFDDAERGIIVAGHFSIVGVNGINAHNFNDIVSWFNIFSDEHGPPSNLAGLRELADAALLGIASEDDDLLGYDYIDRSYAEIAIAALLENATAISFDWTGYYTMLVGIGVYEVEFAFDYAIPLPPLTGTVSISGIALVGQTLTANTAALGGRGEIAFQWLRGDNEIAGATAGTYTVQAADAGHAITVLVSRDGFEGYVESPPTAIVTSPETPAGANFMAQLTWVQTVGVSGTSYLIEISGDEVIAPFSFTRPGVTLIIRGTEPSTISLSGNGSLFTIGGVGVTLVLDENITLEGRPANNNHLVRVNSDGTLIMNPGARITDNTNASTTAANMGGGVRVNSGGTFNMYGGEISGNSSVDNWSSNDGGGVRVESGGTFNMRGGEIFGNNARWASGGGVWNAGTLRISDGIIRGNESELEDDLRNVAGNGAALFNSGSGTTEFGIFGNDGFVRAGTIYTLNPTIHVVNGVFHMPQRQGSLAEQLAWLRDFAQSGGEYTIEVSVDETIGPQSLPSGRSGLAITIRGDWVVRFVNLSSNGSLFTVGSGVTLVLDDNITLVGRTIGGFITANNTHPLVMVNNGGNLVMNVGARITGNTNGNSWTSAEQGGGVRVNSGGIFTMNGGDISGNVHAGLWSAGGGVHLASGGTFNMRGGTISNNNSHDGGGGIHVASGGIFRMRDGIIHGSAEAEGLGNTSSGSGAALLSNGTALFGIFDDYGFFDMGSLRTTDFTVHVINGVLQKPDMEGNLAEQLAWLRDFAQSGGDYQIQIINIEELSSAQATLPTGRSDVTITLWNNEEAMRIIGLSANGSLFTVVSGVTLILDGNITLLGRTEGGFITTDNTQPLVIVNSGGNLVMNTGVRITGNTTSTTANVGGGVRVNSGGTFTMHDGEISANATTWDGGGGVHVVSGGVFNMRGGVITNNNSGWNGGGVFNSGAFRISDGVIFGNTAEEDLRNIASSSGASFFNNGTAQRGTFDAEGAFTQLSTISTSNATIRAVNGVLQMPTEESLVGQFAWLRDFSQSNGEYAIEIGNENLTPAQTGLPTGRSNLTITLWNSEAMRAISLSANGSLFTVGSGVTLVLDGNVTLLGRTYGGFDVTNNTQPLVVVNSGGNLVMNAGVRIMGNTNTTATSSSVGGGVRVNNGGTFTMHGGEILENASTGWNGDGGGVHVEWNGTFAIHGGTIHNNNSARDGGGVHIASGGTFNMRGGRIFNNSASSNGGGVSNSGTFRISDGTVYGNESTVDESLENTALGGAALQNNATAQRGNFVSGTFSQLGTLSSTNDTLLVKNGTLELTGTVEITGVPRVGRILTADISDLDGEGTFSFQWMRGGMEIGTNSSTYTVMAADEGHTITVMVMRTGNFGSVTSGPTEEIISFAHESDFVIRFTDFLNIGVDFEIDTPLRIVGTDEQRIRLITVSGPELDLGSVRWFFEGIKIDDDMVDGETFTLDYRTHGNMIGTRFITVEVMCMDGVLYSKRIAFTVAL